VVTLPRGLCVLVTIWLAWSNPSAASREESSNSTQWWGSEQFARIEKSAKQLRDSGNFAALEGVYIDAIEAARRAGHPRAQVVYRTALGNTYVYLYRYAEALNAYTQARDLAARSDDWLAAGAVAPGMSSVYFLVGDWQAARKTVEDGLQAVRRAGERPYYDAQLKLQYARLYASAMDATGVMQEAIEAARLQPNTALEALAWDLLGEEHLRRGELDSAEAALSEAYRLRVLLANRDLRLSYWRLGALRFAQGRLQEAAQLTDSAIAANLQSGFELSAGTLLHQRGRIRHSLGDLQGALTDFEAAELSAERWRATVPPPSQATLTAADTELDRNVARSFIETAATFSLDTGDMRWGNIAFLAAERNRAASLRQAAELAEVWRSKLPKQYWADLARVRVEETKSLRQPEATSLAERLHVQLSEMEAAAGLGYAPNNLESFRTQASLTLFQQGLGASELFLSFYAGTPDSYVWAVTRDNVHLYRLPSAGQLNEIASEFRRSLTEHNPGQGEAAYEQLFGQLDARERTRHNWLLSLDGPLFGLPFAALRTEGKYLVELHSIQVTPSAALLRTAERHEYTAYLGVADPVYNAADDRLPPSRNPLFSATRQLNRLVASSGEVERSARAWSGPSRFLLGTDATRLDFVETLAATPPATIHFATHVVSGENPSTSFLAFSMGPGGGPELMGAADIAMLRVPHALIVMTGCASGAGEARAGAGLLGLTRAWLAAGADGVLATQWPVEDAGGDLVPSFYKQYPSVSAAEALRRGQVEMLYSGTWQADPLYWAAFQLTSGVR
jgi:CHAT domain-containing protein